MNALKNCNREGSHALSLVKNSMELMNGVQMAGRATFHALAGAARVACITAGVLAASGTLRAETIWIEAEAPAETNFPAVAENPFAPQAFWEEDLLSAGQWIGAFWKREEAAQPFLEYEFEVKEGGRFALYSRKFFTFGNFRWRIDDGEWHSVPDSLHQPLDSVTMRDTPNEKYTVSWHYMGAQELAPGKHRLRIEPEVREPITPDGMKPLPGSPMAYDVFVLTTDVFFPAGKLRPGETFVTAVGSGYAFQPGTDDFLESPIDWRSLNEQFAGEHGGIAAKGAGLILRETGERVRLVGVDLAIGPGAAPEAMRYLARFLAKKGINLARMDIAPVFEGSRDAEGNPAIAPEPKMLESLAAQIAALKAEGIYTALTFNPANIRDAGVFGGFVKKGEYFPGGADFSHLLLHDVRYQNCFAQAWQSVLGAKLPDGTPLGQDPAIALLTLGQQISPFGRAAKRETPAPEFVKQQGEQNFVRWLEKRYGSVKSAVAAWEKQGQKVEEGAGLLPGAEEIAQRRGPRERDAARFLAETQRAWLDGLAHKLRKEAGYAGLISYANRPAARPELLGLTNAWISQGADVVERIGLYNTVFETQRSPWVIESGVRFADRSALRFDALPGGEGTRYELPVKAFAYGNRPVLLTEIAWTAPNRFRGEAPLLAFTLASLQDVPLVAFQSANGFTWHSALPASRLPLLTPAILGQMPALAYAYRMGYLPGSSPSIRWQVPESEIFALKPAPLADAPDFGVDEVPLAQELADGAPPAAAYTAGRVKIELGGKEEKLEVSDEAAAVFADGKLEVGDAQGGEVRWDAERGLLVVDAPKVQAVVGFLKQAGEVSTEQMGFEPAMEFGAVCLVSLDGKPLDFSSRMLLQVFSEERNEGEYLEGSGMRMVRSTGRPPLLVEALKGSLSLNRPDASEISVTALDANGYRVLPVGTANDLRLLPATMYYLLEK